MTKHNKQKERVRRDMKGLSRTQNRESKGVEIVVGWESRREVRKSGLEPLCYQPCEKSACVLGSIDAEETARVKAPRKERPMWVF